jgi:hypothetical protein
MAHFAKVENGIVTQVIVIDQETLNLGHWGDPSLWIQTSYNTKANVHYAPDSMTPDGGVALRGNFAGLGYIYDREHDVFYPPSPFPSWTISEETNWVWQPPTPTPTDGKNYKWNEDTKTWDIVPVITANTSSNTSNTAG